MAIRNALGAQRFTLIREQLTESLLICFTGGAMGVALSIAATRWLAGAWKDLPSAQSIHMDWTVVAFACGLVFTTALLGGLLPAISSTGKSSIRNSAIVVARRKRKRQSQCASQDPAYGGDRCDGGAADCRGAAHQELRAPAHHRYRLPLRTPSPTLSS